MPRWHLRTLNDIPQPQAPSNQRRYKPLSGPSLSLLAFLLPWRRWLGQKAIPSVYMYAAKFIYIYVVYIWIYKEIYKEIYKDIYMYIYI